MKTELLYLEDTFRLCETARVVSVGTDSKGLYCVLDRTVFYPQGGGQPADHGSLSWTGGEGTITHVAIVEEEVRHYGTLNSLVGGEAVKMQVEPTRRLLNAKNHTAGHLVGSLAESLYPALKAVKGYHFSDSPYVEFMGELGEDTGVVISQVNSALEKALQSAAEITAQTASDSVGPQGKPYRQVTIAGYGQAPCGGTHLSSLSQLSRVQVTKIKSKAGALRFSYVFD